MRHCPFGLNCPASWTSSLSPHLNTQAWTHQLGLFREVPIGCKCWFSFSGFFFLLQWAPGRLSWQLLWIISLWIEWAAVPLIAAEGVESSLWCPDSWFAHPWSCPELVFTKGEETHCSAWVRLDFQTAPWWWGEQVGAMANVLMAAGWPTVSETLMDNGTGGVSQHWLWCGGRSTPPKELWSLLKLPNDESWLCWKCLEFWASQPRSCCFWGPCQGLTHRGWTGRLMCHSSLAPRCSYLHPV